MILDSFVPIGNILKEIIDETKSEISEDLYQSRWKSIFDGGKIEFKKHNFLNEKLAYQKITSGTRFEELEQIFFENRNLQKEDFSDFFQTYFYRINNYEFNEDIFRQTCAVLDRRIESEYSRKTFFFIPLWSFHSAIEFNIGNFALRKITPDEFDLVNNIIFYNKDESPIISHYAYDLKYVLEFFIDTPNDGTQHIDPLKFAQIILDSLRILKTGNVRFGSFYQFQPEDWRHMAARPADPEPNIQHGNKMQFYETDKKELKSLFSELKILNESGKCQDHPEFQKECKNCVKESKTKTKKIRYLKFAIRRFQYIFHEVEVGDKITDLMISMEALLNFEPYEVRDKTSRRAGFFIENDAKKRKIANDFFKKCYDIRSEIVHAKERKAKIMQDEQVLKDEDVEKKLQSYVRKAIIKMLKLQNEIGSQEKILEGIEDSIFGEP